ncbi:MAG: hypothetical protein ACK52I_02870 [Pseudomonadota bacterium]|jgi:hypothetical protein
MNVGELKKYLADLPDEMPIGILDLSTDDIDDGNYKFTHDSLMVEEGVDASGDPLEKDVLFITFHNKLNPKPIK